MTIIPMREMKNTVSIEKRCQTGPVFVTKNGYGSLVVMNIDYYSKTFAKLSEAAELQKGLADLSAGRVVPGEQIRSRIKEKYAF